MSTMAMKPRSNNHISCQVSPEYFNKITANLPVSDLPLPQFIFNTMAKVTLLKYVSLKLSCGSQSP